LGFLPTRFALRVGTKNEENLVTPASLPGPFLLFINSYQQRRQTMSKQLLQSSYNQIAELDNALRARSLDGHHFNIEQLRNEFLEATLHYEMLTTPNSDATDPEQHQALHDMWTLSDELAQQMRQLDL